ncbi:MAG: hypothetical protein J7M38_09000 [Armatimonadetes bacterium]|nr:hypothetical protein [Armatimonadota bacterium]
MWPSWHLDRLVAQVCSWAYDNPVSAGSLAIVIIYVVFRSLAVRPGRGDARG